jgi:hypothetical protein
VLDELEGIVTEVTAEPPDVAEKMPPPEVDARSTVVADPTVTGVPKAFWTWTVMAPRVALDDAEPDTAVEVITNLSMLNVSEMFPAHPAKELLPFAVAAWPPSPLSSVVPFAVLCPHALLVFV